MAWMVAMASGSGVLAGFGGSEALTCLDYCRYSNSGVLIVRSVQDRVPTLG